MNISTPMKKTHYQKELLISATQKRKGTNNKEDVLKIQSWLSLYSIWNPNSGTATGMDGDFGAATEKAVKNFQNDIGVSSSGVVTKKLFEKLCENMKLAFEKPLSSSNLRDLVVEAAENHVANFPHELNIKGASNCGPWVRAYMDGHDGTKWFWCMGFVQAIIDQAASVQNKNFKKLMPLTYSCDKVGNVGLQNKILTRNEKLRKDSSTIKKGDIFLIRKSMNDWTHTGIITAVHDDVIETIEGNTNQGGSRNGVAVYKRTRNFKKSKIDVFSIEPLVINRPESETSGTDENKSKKRKTLRYKSKGSEVTELKELLVKRGYDITISNYFNKDTKSVVEQFQKDSGLGKDGVVGKNTWAKLLEIAPKLTAVSQKRLTEQDFIDFAKENKLELAVVKAVTDVESNGKGYLRDGRPVILFEGHVFWKQLQERGIDPKRFSANRHRNILYKSWTKEHYMGKKGEYTRLEKAAGMSDLPGVHDAAYCAASWGAFQIMGYHYKKLGYESVDQFASEMYGHEREHLKAFGRFISLKKSSGKLLIDWLREKNWDQFALGYNGSGYKKNKYHTKLEKSYQNHND